MLVLNVSEIKLDGIMSILIIWLQKEEIVESVYSRRQRR